MTADNSISIRFKNQWTGSFITCVRENGQYAVNSQKEDPSGKEKQVWCVQPQVTRNNMQTGRVLISVEVRNSEKLYLTCDPGTKTLSVRSKRVDVFTTDDNTQLWTLSTNTISCVACPGLQLSLPSNSHGASFVLKKFNPDAWGGAHQKYDFITQEILEFDKVRSCADMLRNVLIRFNDQNAFLTAENQRSRSTPVSMTFTKRESFDNKQLFNIIPTPDEHNSRNFHIESVKIPGYFLQVSRNQNTDGSEAIIQLYNNMFQRWNLKKTQLSCSGASFYGMSIGTNIEFYLSEVFNFTEEGAMPGKLCMDDLDSAFIETTNKLRSKIRHAREQANWLCLLQFNRMCLKYTPNTSRGTKLKMTQLINQMEQRNASYADDIFAVEKNGLSLQHYDECLKDAGYWMDKAAKYMACNPREPGNQGYPFALWMLLHYVTVQASDEDARTCAAIIANYILTFYHNDRMIADFAVQLKQHSISKVTNNNTLVMWLWQIHVGIVQNGKHKKASDNDIEYLQSLYPNEAASPESALDKLEETFHPLAMVFNGNEEWLPDDGEEIILTAPPTISRSEYNG